MKEEVTTGFTFSKEYLRALRKALQADEDAEKQEQLQEELNDCSICKGKRSAYCIAHAQLTPGYQSNK